MEQRIWLLNESSEHYRWLEVTSDNYPFDEWQGSAAILSPVSRLADAEENCLCGGKGRPQ